MNRTSPLGSPRTPSPSLEQGESKSQGSPNIIDQLSSVHKKYTEIFSQLVSCNQSISSKIHEIRRTHTDKQAKDTAFRALQLECQQPIQEIRGEKEKIDAIALPLLKRLHNGSLSIPQGMEEAASTYEKLIESSSGKINQQVINITYTLDQDLSNSALLDKVRIMFTRAVHFLSSYLPPSLVPQIVPVPESIPVEGPFTSRPPNRLNFVPEELENGKKQD